MEQKFWLRQTDSPLFPELEWSRPETKLQAGKLLIIGGSATGFVEPSEAYMTAEKAGVGTIRMLLPDSLRQYVGKTFTAGSLAPTTPSGSFSKAALACFVDESAWADGVLLAGGIGRNSETAVLLENFLEKYDGQTTLVKDAADIFCQQPISILHRPETLFVVSMGQLRRLGSEARFPRAFTSEMGVVQLVDALHEFSKRFAFSLITRHQNYYIAAENGQVSTTKLTREQNIWRLHTAATASVWWLQNPGKTLEAITTAIYEVSSKTHQS
jgi:ADP-dependent NAD(P)H-hydrate dehydratase / NAD(P)H-hydrate epimerase